MPKIELEHKKRAGNTMIGRAIPKLRKDGTLEFEFVFNRKGKSFVEQLEKAGMGYELIPTINLFEVKTIKVSKTKGKNNGRAKQS